MENVLTFLKELRENNNREWFQANKKKYIEARETFERLVSKLIAGVAKIDKDLASLAVRDCVFRIYRDVRFSSDKSPYKVNFAAVFSKGGRKSFNASYYLHLEPGNTFAGGGIWMPPGNILKAIRQEIYYNPDDFKSIISDNGFNKYFGEFMGDKLLRPPVGFPKDFPDIEFLKFKSYAVGSGFRDADVLNNDFEAMILKRYRVLQPFIEFLNRAVYGVKE